MNKKDKDKMVLLATKDQLFLKTLELDEGVCWWSISNFPKNQDEMVGEKIYFYVQKDNKILKRATIVGFGEVSGKKVVYFKNNPDDVTFRKIDLTKKGIPKTKQTRGWTYLKTLLSKK